MFCPDLDQQVEGRAQEQGGHMWTGGVQTTAPFYQLTTHQEERGVFGPWSVPVLINIGKILDLNCTKINIVV